MSVQPHHPETPRRGQQLLCTAASAEREEASDIASTAVSDDENGCNTSADQIESVSSPSASPSFVGEPAGEQQEDLLEDPLETDISVFRPSTDSFEALLEGEFTKLRKLGTGIGGEVFAYRRRGRRGAEDVAVKTIRKDRLRSFEGTETNDRKIHLQLSKLRRPFQEDPLTEIGVLKYLVKQADLPLYILRLQGIFAHKDGGAWVLSELADGDLFNQVQKQGAFGPTRTRDLSWQLLQAVAYLHRHRIGHRDISMENLLLKDDTLRLMDFGMAVRSATEAGTELRYYRTVGKEYYRAPECHVPTEAQVAVEAPSGALPGQIVTVALRETFLCEVRLPEDVEAGEACTAEVYGYAVAPADVFSVGVCMLIMLMGGPAFGSATCDDPVFTYVRENSLTTLLKHRGVQLPSEELYVLLEGMLQWRSAQRLSVEECLTCEWYADLHDTPVARHPGRWRQE